MNTAHDKDPVLSASGTIGARLRLATLNDDGRIAMTQAARASKHARYIERLKDVVDPGRTWTDEERTRAANDLAEARRAKAELGRLRTEAQRKLDAANEAYEAELAS